jgi:hypothetical protein
VKTGRVPEEARRIAPTFVGLTEAEAASRAEADGLVVRVVRRDDQTWPLELDRRPNRINLVIERGLVADAINDGKNLIRLLV